MFVIHKKTQLMKEISKLKQWCFNLEIHYSLILLNENLSVFFMSNLTRIGMLAAMTCPYTDMTAMTNRPASNTVCKYHCGYSAGVLAWPVGVSFPLIW